METKNLSLIYVNPVGINRNGLYEYEFFFSDNPDTVWAGDWNISSPSACSDLIPEESMYQLVERLEVDIKLFPAQDNSCFSMQDVQDHVLSLCFENLEGLEEYPSPYRLVFMYGDKYDIVTDLLKGRNFMFNKNSED